MYSWRHCSIRFSTWKIKTYMPKKGNKKDQDSQILFLIYNTWTKTMVYIFPCHQHSMVGFILKEICSPIGTPGISIRDIQGSNYHIPHYWIFKKMDRLQWDMKCLPSKATYRGFESGINLSQKIIIIILGGGGAGGRFGNFVHRVQPLPFYQGSMVTLGYPGYVSIKIVYFNWFIHEQKGKIKTQANTRVWSEWILYLRKTQEVK